MAVKDLQIADGGDGFLGNAYNYLLLMQHVSVTNLTYSMS